MKGRKAYSAVKRILDIVFSSVLLLLLSFPMLIIAVSIALTSDGGVLFRQERVGVGGEKFICLKFRTMYTFTPSSCPKSQLLSAERYITPVGRFLRKTSLDELPQLFNVLMGDMSLVGPRPLVAEEGEIHSLRHRCGVYGLRPGITGLAQISGRDDINDLEKVRLDAKYAKGVSLRTDAGIIVRTFFHLATGK